MPSASVQPIVPLRQARKEFTLNCIRDAARELFFAQGYAGVTMEQIAEAAGTRRSTLYNHFRDKEEILSAIAQDYSGALVKIIEAVPGPTPSREELALWVGEVAKFVMQERVPTVLLSEVGAGMHEFAASHIIGTTLLDALATRLPAFKKALGDSDRARLTRIGARIVLRNLSWCCLQWTRAGNDRREDYLVVATDLVHDFISRSTPD